jgi:phosphoesterase RecJ-like protein
MVQSEKSHEAFHLLSKSTSCLITTHTKPDGDACGCMAAMRETLITLGKQVKLLVPTVVPHWYQFLFDEKVSVLDKDVKVQELIEDRSGKFDLIIIVDTGSYTQLDEFEKYLKYNSTAAKHVPVLVIDHHATSGHIGNVELIEPAASAAGLIVLDLLKYSGWQITPKTAEALFVAIATDTGWFEFNNTDSRVLRSCAELIEAGAKPNEIYNKLYQNFPYSRFKLLVTMLNTLELHFGQRYAAVHLLQRDFDATGSTYEDTENMINESQRIGSVKVSALFVELKDGRIRCSLRSRCDLDVSRIAAKFGGGGHKMAAGTYLPGPLENAKRLIYEQVAGQLSKDFS